MFQGKVRSSSLAFIGGLFQGYSLGGLSQPNGWLVVRLYPQSPHVGYVIATCCKPHPTANRHSPCCTGKFTLRPGWYAAYNLD